MIGLLQGERVENWHQGSKQGVLVFCSGVGYEVQLAPRHLLEINSQEKLVLWVHHLKREEEDTLFGFPQKEERDLFRTLIGVNGVGPQMAISLIEACNVNELIDAIINQDLQKLSTAQGVGKKTAERLAVELRGNLTKFNVGIAENTSLGNKSTQSLINPSCLQEVQLTLAGLGYEDIEIRKALGTLTKKSDQSDLETIKQELPSPNDTEAWLRAFLKLLCQDSL